MRVTLTLRPGARGTKKLVERYGASLVAVRYRMDPTTGQRVKTVEVIVERWRRRRRREDPDELLLVGIAYDEIELQRRVRAVQGVWNRTRRGWELRRHLVVALGLEDRIIGRVEEGPGFE